MGEPVLVALLFADRVITEKNNKKGIIGTFTYFHSDSFPAVFAPWYIYAAMTNLEGEHDFSLNLVYDKTKQVIVPINGKIKVDDEQAVVELSFPITGAIFPEEGNYTLTFNIDRKQIGSRVLKVTQTQARGGGS